MQLHQLFKILAFSHRFELVILALCLFFPHLVMGDESRNDKTGLFELSTPRMLLITDKPIDDELRSWPGLLEQSMVQWQTYFRVEQKAIDGLKVTTHLIVDLEKFQKSGLMDRIPEFQEGYQLGDRLFVRDQPSAYYRRHLFLHEATHWIMWHLFGGGGSPWFMEGMADMQGTHLLNAGRLKLGIIPSSPIEVPYWGRLRLIDDALKQGDAPSISEILAYQSDRDILKRYAWSWAACVFFTNHPMYGPVLRDCYAGKLDYSNALSKKLKAKLGDSWNDVNVDWNGFISDLDFGYDVSRSMVVCGEPSTTNFVGKQKLKLETERGWQSTGFKIEKGRPVHIECQGRFRVRSIETPKKVEWFSEPQGITIEYYRRNPLGCVLASVVPEGETEHTKRWETQRIGKSATITSTASGTLFLKVNEASSGLRDNFGSISVIVSQGAK